MPAQKPVRVEERKVEQPVKVLPAKAPEPLPKDIIKPAAKQAPSFLEAKCVR